MTTLPSWSAARSGLLGDTGAVDASAGINQFLGTHPGNAIYAGNSILTPNGLGGTDWTYHLDAYDVDQPFTLTGTSIGRVAIPLLPIGSGGDMIVSLCSNSSGVPGSVITQTRIPANWITALSAVSSIGVPNSTAPFTADSNNPLATAANYVFHIGPWTTGPWTFPSVSASSLLFPNTFTSLPGNYFITLGGTDSGGNRIANTFTYFYDGTALGTAVAQPSLPQALFSAAAVATSDTIICLGGNGTVTLSTVYTASWDGAGTVGAWSQQASLPQPIEQTTSGAATWNDTYVYLVGGDNGTTIVGTVYWAQVQNGQITSWNTAQSLPQSVAFPSVAVFDNMLVVTGGTPPSGPQVVSNTYYAPINADGSLGSWQTGPSSPVPTLGGIVSTDSGMLIIGGWASPAFSPTNDLQSLSFGASGPGSWFRGTYNGTLPSPNSSPMFAIFPLGTDTWQVFDLTPTAYLTATLTRTPVISFPLPATGLTNGVTYHIVISQPVTDLNNYVRLADDFNVFTGSPTVLTRAKGTSAWTAGTTGHAVPLAIYDNTVGGLPWHTWEDSGARISTLVYATTPDQRLLGILDATAQPAPVLNQNPTFTRGTAPWHVTNGTFTQSNTFTHGQLPFSAKLTPNGTSSQAFVESDLVPVQQGHQYVLSAWYYSPTGYSNIDISVNWFDVNRSYITTTSGTATSIAAGTWTMFQTTVTANVANAVYLDMVVIEGGTPPATAVLYVSAATVQDASGPQLSSVAQIGYPGTWPGAVWPPTGITVLA